MVTRPKARVQIKSGVLEHECARDHHNRHVSAEWIAKNYLEQFRADPSWRVAGIVQAVKTNQEVDISRLKAYRAKCIAQRIIDGDEESQMARLYDYRLELVRTHPGSTVIIKYNEEVFESMYVCLALLRAGFLSGCRKLVSLDGCFLKGLYGGQLLSAVGIDANDCIYPIAWAVVSKENKENWTWFLQILAQDLMINNSHQWAFMTDRQKGLIPAIAELFPMCEHRYCVRHIHTNFKKTFRGKALKDQLWSCARATYTSAFNRALEGLKQMNLGAFDCILEARTKGIITMNETMRTQLMKRIQKMRDAMQKVTTLHRPRIVKKLEKSKELSWFYSTTWKWQLSGIPCSHSVSAMYYNKEKPENYLDSCYLVSTFMETYSHILSPTHDRDSWPKSDQGPIIPPQAVNNRKGRKTRTRRKDLGETSGFNNGKVSKKGVKMRCGICGAVGHNKRFHGMQKGNKGSPALYPLVEGTAANKQPSHHQVEQTIPEQSDMNFSQSNDLRMSSQQTFSAITNPAKSSSTGPGNVPVGKSQVKYRDGKRPGNADKKRKVWVPPGAATLAGASDVYKKGL
ncbi:uncharacterized protein LOC120273231 [Dioscorea cayenensis subsp. rotundata]|uniref:Uncharacterized protein LOC120273231 n=1 Tax=Dioscorea cayennensis subsp. rotundata TaxID=55577 RepID=A0AB40CAF8_DIOCR|nr:uncharacterized protein LOC120273231 [Dioscorea cayenensis subsp. rotundata]